MKKAYVCLLFTLLSAIMTGCAKDEESISAEDSSILMSEEGGKEYALLLTWPGDRQYSEDNQALINAYIELNSMAENVTVDTNKMSHFTEKKDIGELEWIIYESDL